MINQSGIPIKLNYTSVAGMMTMVVYLGAIADVHASSDADYRFVVDSDWHNCQQISTSYQEVYAFETPNFYVNICQKDDIYFYSGEAKQSNTNSIFIPAIPLENNRGFQAQNGNVSYVVILPFPEKSDLEPSNLHPEEAILTIRRNDRLVAVESSLNKYCHQSEAISLTSLAIAFENIELNSPDQHPLGTITQYQDISLDLFSSQSPSNLPTEIFNLNSQFDFYRIDGKLHRLATCN